MGLTAVHHLDLYISIDKWHILLSSIWYHAQIRKSSKSGKYLGDYLNKSEKYPVPSLGNDWDCKGIAESKKVT